MQTSAPAPAAPIPLDLSRIAQDLQIRKMHVENVMQMLDEEMSPPFIARYRRERTGGLGEDIIRRIQFRLGLLRHLVERKQTILKTLENQGKLTPEFRDAIIGAESPRRLEDLFLPYKPKRRSPASDAREKGLEPLGQAIWTKDPVAANLPEMLQAMVNPEKKLTTPDEVLQGVRNLLAEIVSEQAELRGALRAVVWETGKIACKRNEAMPENRGQEFKGFFDFSESVQQIPPHRILAINRGEKEEALKVHIDINLDRVKHAVAGALPLTGHPHAELLQSVVEDAVMRIVLPSLEREARRELTEFAQDHAVTIFCRNLRAMMLQRPLRRQRILGIDPGLRSGCRIVALDEAGNLLEHGIIHPNQPFNRKRAAKVKIEEFLRKHQLNVIALGNGTGCRDTEKLIAELIADLAAGKSSQMPASAEPAAEPVAPVPDAVVAESSMASADSAPAVAEAPAEPTPPASETPVVENAPPQPAEPSPADDSPPTEAVAAPIEAPAEPAPAASAPVPPSPPKLPDLPEQPPVDLSVLPPPPADISYVIVNEAGAKEYASSPSAREEFPEFDATLRSAISIGRRLQDPMAELVKVDPQHVGVGLYQQDVRPKHLRASLEGAVQSCVNNVGADVNASEVSLLRFVSGLNPLIAREIVEYRRHHGPFRSRDQLKQIASINDKRFEQLAGFLRIVGGDEPLDETWIHPENYPVVREILKDLGLQPADLRDAQKVAESRSRLNSVHPEVYAAKFNCSIGSIKDLFDLIADAGRDPRDDQPPPIFRKSVLKIEDLQPGMELKGTVLNVVDFGAFVDIGLKDGGLVHISQLANRFVKNPHDFLAVGDLVVVWVRTVDKERRHVSLTMIAPGSEKPAPERRQGPPRTERRESPPPPPREHGQPPHGHDRGQRRGRPPRRDQRREDAPPPPPPPPPRPLKPPGKPKPLPKLTVAALKGQSPLHSFGELEAFFRAKQEPDVPAPPAAPETPAAEPVPPPPQPE